MYGSILTVLFAKEHFRIVNGYEPCPIHGLVKQQWVF